MILQHQTNPGCHGQMREHAGPWFVWVFFVVVFWFLVFFCFVLFFFLLLDALLAFLFNKIDHHKVSAYISLSYPVVCPPIQ